MADPHRTRSIVTDREPWGERMLRELTDAQTTHWRFRLFGPLTSAARRPTERPETPPVAVVAAQRTFA